MFDVYTIAAAVRKYLSRRDIAVITCLVALFVLTRTVNLTGFPIFTDEGIYIRWSLVAWKDASWRFISLTDGRQPLQTWATIPFLKLFPTDTLLAGRLFGVTSGFFALSGCMALLGYLHGRRAAYIGGFLYCITPYFLFYDRMALVDSAVNAGAVWIFFLSIILARTRRLDIALILGMIAGLSLLGKSSVRLYLLCASGAAIFIEGWRQSLMQLLREKVTGSSFTQKVLNFSILYGIVLALAYAIYNVQRLSPYFHFIEEKNKTFVLSFHEILQAPFNYFSHNIVSIPYYLGSEMAYVIPIIGLVGLYVLWKEHRQFVAYSIFWLLTITLVLAVGARVLNPRYVIPLGSILLISAAALLARIHSRSLLAGALALCVLSVLYFNFTILFRPAAIPFPQIDRGQYIEEWPSGWGIADIAAFTKEKALEKPVLILAEGDFGMSGDVLRAQIGVHDAIEVKGFWPLTDEDLQQHRELVEEKYVYVVYAHCKESQYQQERTPDQRCDTFAATKPLLQKAVYHKPGGTSAIYFFELKPLAL